MPTTTILTGFTYTLTVSY